MFQWMDSQQCVYGMHILDIVGYRKNRIQSWDGFGEWKVDHKELGGLKWEWAWTKYIHYETWIINKIPLQYLKP